MSEPVLPALYSRWVESIVGCAIAPETKATCSQCVMCTEDVPEDKRFRPDTKCCTYQPTLPNFLVGFVLADTSPEAEFGYSRVRAQVREHRGTTPFGISPPPSFTKSYKSLSQTGQFGLADIQCSYYQNVEGGLCGIWRHRNGICSTWFCQHVRDELGRSFWSVAADVLSTLEEQLALDCMRQLGIDLRAIDQLIDSRLVPKRSTKGDLHLTCDPDGRILRTARERLWGRWLGREEDFFVACGELARDLTWEQLKAKNAIHFSVLEARLREAFARQQSEELPPILCKTASDHYREPSEGRVHLRAVGSTAVLSVQPEMEAALEEFDGRPTDQVRASIREVHGLDLDEATLKSLFLKGLLAPPDGRDVPPMLRPRHALHPEDWVCFFRNYADLPVDCVEGRDEEGEPFLTVICAGETTLDAPAFIEFAKALVANQSGFRAGTAAEWGPPGNPVGWVVAEALLTRLLELNFLQRRSLDASDFA